MNKFDLQQIPVPDQPIPTDYNGAEAFLLFVDCNNNSFL